LNSLFLKIYIFFSLQTKKEAEVASPELRSNWLFDSVLFNL
jgi:hypothetical protein